LTALLLRVEATVGAGVAVSALLLAHALPNGLLGPVAGAIADRIEQRTLMIVADVGRAVLFLVMAATLPPFVALVSLFAVASVLEVGFRPAGRSVIPALVERDDLMTANAWLVTAGNLGSAIGPLIGGVLVAAVGVSGALGVNAISFLASAGLLLGLPALRVAEPETERIGLLAATREGLRFARRDRVMRGVIVGLVLGAATAALDNVALVFMATRVFDSGPTGFGMLESVFGIGMILASAIFIKRRKISPAAVFTLGWLGTAIGNFGVGLAPTIAAAGAAQLIGGAGNGAGLVGGDTLIQRSVPKQMLGRALGASGSAPFIGMLIAYAAGGLLVDTFGARETFLISGVATTLVATFVWSLLRGTRT